MTKSQIKKLLEIARYTQVSNIEIFEHGTVSFTIDNLVFNRREICIDLQTSHMNGDCDDFYYVNWGRDEGFRYLATELGEYLDFKGLESDELAYHFINLIIYKYEKIAELLSKIKKEEEE